MKISHSDRLRATLAGEKPDRIPVAFWHHLPVDDQDPTKFAKAVIGFQEQFDFDLVKVTPASSYCLKDWGAKDEWRGKDEGTRAYTHHVIEHPEDWRKLKILDPNKGHLSNQLESLQILKDSFGGDTPYLQTIYSPLAQAKNLVGAEKLIYHIRKYPDAVHEGLRIIQSTTNNFIEALKNFGIAGIFYAIQHASYRILTEEEYRVFGMFYDVPILESANSFWANIVHLHGLDVMFDLIADYPVQIVNWHDRETQPSLAEGLARFKGTVCGGLSRINTMVLGDNEKINREVLDAVEQTSGKRFILSSGCVLPLTTPFGNIEYARDIVKEINI
jgi:uroporphyrinogen decarboxylase